MTETPRSSKAKSTNPSAGKTGAGKTKTGSATPDSEQTPTGRNGPWWHQPRDPDAAHAEAVGSATQEAAKLASALADWASRAGLAEVVRGFAEQTAETVKAAASKASQTPRRYSASEGEGDTTAEGADEPGEGAEGADEAADEGDWDEHLGYGESIVVCNECPVCQGMAFLRVAQPEIADSVAEALAGVTAVIRAAIGALVPTPPTPTRFEHIDLD